MEDKYQVWRREFSRIRDGRLYAKISEGSRLEGGRWLVLKKAGQQAGGRLAAGLRVTVGNVGNNRAGPRSYSCVACSWALVLHQMHKHFLVSFIPSSCCALVRFERMHTRATLSAARCRCRCSRVAAL